MFNFFLYDDLFFKITMKYIITQKFNARDIVESRFHM